MKTDNIIEWVKENVGHIESHGGFFIDHLLGTYHLLKMWGQREDLCNAGLCHSFYETTFFKKDFLENKFTREEVVDLIGTEAEYLVYLFCYMPDRFKSLLENRYDLPPDLHEDLLKLELANFVEQVDRMPNWSEGQQIYRFYQMVDLIKQYDKDFYAECPWG